MDIESDIEFILHIHESERFPAQNEDRSCGSALTDNARSHERKTHRPFQDCASASKAVPQP